MTESNPKISAPTIGELLGDARRRLAGAAFAPEPREARVLLGWVLGLSEAQLFARSHQPVAGGAIEHFDELLERRLAGEPVAYLLGEREFYGRAFLLDRRVLIPRPETELLIEAALGLELPPAPRILDVGAGCGSIAITLACEIPGARVVATDISRPALQVLRANVERHRVRDRVLAVAADLTSGIRIERMDLVLSNPPYVDEGEADQLSVEVREYEPHVALFAPGGGHCLIERLLVAARTLRAGTHLLMEIGYGQDDWLRRAVAAAGGIELVDVLRDYGGIPRTAMIRSV
ncbi:MAG: peptide chain release factor N(5)-glutamine methyltransferase [bacterium]|nr:peptide chain release factor N(5)-glutamine methyltransferase [bacterium]